MKRISLTLSIILAVTLGALAQVNADGTRRVVLKAAKEFNKIEIEGPAVVELKYHPQRGCYIYYNTADNSAKRIDAKSYDDGRLAIKADSVVNALATRITVLYDKPMEKIAALDHAIIVAKDLKAASSIKIETNGLYTDTGVYLAEIKAENVTLQPYVGTMGVGKLQADNLTVDGTFKGVLKLIDCDVKNLEADVRGACEATIGGKAKNALVNISLEGTIDMLKLKCKNITASICDASTLHCDPVGSFIVNKIGDGGKVVCPRMPKELESNVGYDVIVIEK